MTIVERTEEGHGNDAVDRALADLDHRIGARDGNWVIDAEGFETLNSEHIAALIRIVRRVNLAGGRIALWRPNPFVRSVLQSLRLGRILPIVDDPAQTAPRG